MKLKPDTILPTPEEDAAITAAALLDPDAQPYTDLREHAAKQARPDCPKCGGTGTYMYDHNHSTICDLCCRHDLGWWQLQKYYGINNGRWCCRAGCGYKVDSLPVMDDR